MLATPPDTRELSDDEPKGVALHNEFRTVLPTKRPRKHLVKGACPAQRARYRGPRRILPLLHAPGRVCPPCDCRTASAEAVCPAASGGPLRLGSAPRSGPSPATPAPGTRS